MREREESGMTPKFLSRASRRTELSFTEVTVGGKGLEEGYQELSIGDDKFEMHVKERGEWVVKETVLEFRGKVWLEMQIWKSLWCTWYFLSHRIE